MTQEEFNGQFKELFSGMVQLAFEYVNNDSEVEEVYVYADLEGGMHYFNTFFKINGKFAQMHSVNDFLTNPVETSLRRKKEVSELGIEDIKKIRSLFDEFQGKVPTCMKFIYSTKNDKLDSDISYDLHHTDTENLLPSHVFDQWFEELKNS